MPKMEKKDFRILIVDDELNMRKTLAAVLKLEGYQLDTASSGIEALKKLASSPYELIITDMMMPQMDGIQLLRELKSRSIDIPVIVMTAHGAIENAVEAMKLGAIDYLTKPFNMDEMKLRILRLVQQRDIKRRSNVLQRQVMALKSELTSFIMENPMIGSHPKMEQIKQLMAKSADHKSTVLIRGESGVGKELVARGIHYGGIRREAPFVKVNCAALPETLIESELFGYEKGAFSGADKQKPGRFELADKGTIFLDEIGELAPSTQAKLLRVLQDESFERLGGQETIKVDVRVIAATNKDLKAEIQKGRFREDLYYRLSVIELEVPPLRDRSSDIPMLVKFFIEKYAQETKKVIKGIEESAMELLSNHSWPGNVRELENAIERAMVLSNSDILKIEDFGFISRESKLNGKNSSYSIEGSLEAQEREAIQQALAKCEGNKSKAAELLGIGRSTLWRKMKKYNLE